MELPCRVLNAVQITAGNKDKVFLRDNTKVDLRNKTFYGPPPVMRKWAMINYGAATHVFSGFKDWMLETKKQKGFNFEKPMEINIASEISADGLLKMAKDAGFQFIFIVLADRNEIHDALKYYEQQYQVVTQITKVSVVNKAYERNQGVTLEKILFKTCLKNGGVPYGVDTCKGSLKIITDDILYIGVGYSHQQGSGGSSRRFMQVPSRIGYAATCAFHSNKIIGDFKFIEPHNNEAAFNAIVQIVGECLEAFSKNRKKAVPKIVVIYLTGDRPNSSSSSRTRRPWSGCTSWTGAAAGPRRPTSSPVLASPPGCKRFYLHPHIVLQGTARSAKYSVLVNEPNVPLADIEHVTHTLCFLHSVCLTPTAEPAVLTIADRCAIRGQTVLKYHMRANRLEEFSVEDANRLLTNPLNGPLHAVRYNA